MKIVKHLDNVNVKLFLENHGFKLAQSADAIACAHVKSLYTLFDYNIQLFKLVMKFLYSSVIVC